MDKDKTPSEPRLDEDLAVEDESAEKVIGGHSLSHKTSPAHTHSHTSHPDHSTFDLPCPRPVWLTATSSAG